MPFKSEKQRKWMWANDPKMAAKWEKKEKKMKREMKVRELIKKMVREELAGLDEAAKRDYKAEYKKFQSSDKSKKYRAELNKYNRQKGTYGNGDGKDASHKGGKIVGFEKESVNRGRAEKSRLKKEGKLTEKIQKYVVASTYGTLFSGAKGVTEKQALKIMDRYEKVGMNLFMLGVQYWNKPHKYNKKKIMVKEGKLSEDFKNNEWEVYVADEKGKEKIVKVAKSKRAGVILYNKLINSDKFHEVGMRVIKEGKITETNKSLPPFEIAKRMMKSKYWNKAGKGFSEKVIKKFRGRGVTPKSLDKWLPDYIDGKEISKLFEGKLTESGAQIAKTILKQLGGNKFIAMTGAKNLGHTNKGLQMKIGRNSKGVTHVIIDLDRGKDLYDIEFVKVRGTKRTTVKKLKGIYADQLGEVFTRYTGLRIRL